MLNWFKLNIGDAILASDKLAQIEELILLKHQNSESDTEVVAYTRHESDGYLHCQVKVYFSPKASLIAKEFNATPCAKPSPNELSLLVGDEGSWSLFFPEHNRK